VTATTSGTQSNPIEPVVPSATPALQPPPRVGLFRVHSIRDSDSARASSCLRLRRSFRWLLSSQVAKHNFASRLQSAIDVTTHDDTLTSRSSLLHRPPIHQQPSLTQVTPNKNCKHEIDARYSQFYDSRIKTVSASGLVRPPRRSPCRCVDVSVQSPQPCQRRGRIAADPGNVQRKEGQDLPGSVRHLVRRLRHLCIHLLSFEESEKKICILYAGLPFGSVPRSLTPCSPLFRLHSRICFSAPQRTRIRVCSRSNFQQNFKISDSVIG
jgi:hypothetical protein